MIEGDWCVTHERPRCRPGPGTTSDGRHCTMHARGTCVFVTRSITDPEGGDKLHDGPIVLGQEASDRLDEIMASPSGPPPAPPLPGAERAVPDQGLGGGNSGGASQSDAAGAAPHDHGRTWHDHGSWEPGHVHPAGDHYRDAETAPATARRREGG